MKSERIKLLRISVLSALILSALISFVRFNAECDELKNNILRLHIIANSDSADDQNLKLKVRDAILALGCTEFESVGNIGEAVLQAESSAELFKKTALTVINENGFDYDVSVCVENTYFDTREYDDFTLPAGYYDALCVKIGEAKGKNWWCVMYPAICVPAASANLNSAVSDDAAFIAENPENFVFKFKTVEIFEEIKNFFKNYK